MFKKCELQLALKIKLLVAKERTLSYLYSNPINQKKTNKLVSCLDGEKHNYHGANYWCQGLLCTHTHTHTHIYILVVINII